MMQGLFHLYPWIGLAPVGSRESEARSFRETLRETRNGPPGFAQG